MLIFFYMEMIDILIDLMLFMDFNAELKQISCLNYDIR